MNRTIRIALAAALAGVCGSSQAFQGPGRYEIANVANGKLVTLDTSNQTSVIQLERRGLVSQQWDIVPAGPDVYYIRSAANGRAIEMTADRNGAPVEARVENNDNQHWRFETARDGSAMIISRFRKPMDIPDGTTRDGARIQVYDRNGGDNQRFLLRRVGGEISERRDPPIFDGRDRGRGGIDPSGKYFDDHDRMWKIPGDGACFYRERDFNGEALCVRSGNNSPDVQREAGGAFLSVKFFGRARSAELFERAAFRGQAFRLNRDESDLRRVGAASFGSLRVQ